MQWQVTTPASGSVATWEQLKAQIRPASPTEQTFVMDTLAEVTAYAEVMLEMCLLPQTITAIYGVNDLPTQYGLYWNQVPPVTPCLDYVFRFPLPRGPIISINSVTDCNGNAIAYTRQTAGNAEYVVPTASILPAQCPVTIVYQAGFTAVPLDIVRSIKVLTATAYQYRSTHTNLPANDIAKLDNYFRFRGRGSSVH